MNTIEEVKARCEEVGDCWIWQGKCTSTGYPQAKINGKATLVRRHVAALKGITLVRRQPVRAICDDPKCCNPAHIRASTVKEIAEIAGSKGKHSAPSKCIAIALDKRKKSKLNMEQAQEIRLSAESGPVLAERYGVHKSLINMIKQGKAWKDYSSPFAGLFSANNAQGRARA